ncbi:CGNR zinc finger domain-containing protein [Lacisediminihabitans sp. FW035]
MHFAPDTEETLEFAVALSNTDPGASKSGVDEIDSIADLEGFLTRWIYSGRIDHDAAELAQVRHTRALARRLWGMDVDDSVTEINRILAKARALPRLERHDDLPWHLHATEPEAPLAERMIVEIALAFVDVIRSGETARLRSCEAPDCTGVLVDLSRNGSKRYCSVRCGNRMNMVAFRERATQT